MTKSFKDNEIKSTQRYNKLNKQFEDLQHNLKYKEKSWAKEKENIIRDFVKAQKNQQAQFKNLKMFANFELQVHE